MVFRNWAENPPSFTKRYSVARTNGWKPFLDYYTGEHNNAALRRIVDIAAEHDVKSVLVETRYIDADWRSEHARFYSTTYARYPSIAHRAHFFTERLPRNLADLSALKAAYKGYTILRPVQAQPVGRTMIEPPPELADAIRCEETEQVDVLGWPMKVRAMPFMSQDAQYLRCAHAGVWMVLRHAYLRNQLPRYLPEHVHEATKAGVVVARQVPSEGISRYQMMGGMSALGLSPITLELPQTKADSDRRGSLGLFGILCRYVNSNISPVVFSNSHVWLIVAYIRKGLGANATVTLYRHDDAAGPYIKVHDPWGESSETHRPWHQVIVPLPPKIYMTAERAELIAKAWFEQWIADGDPDGVLTDAKDRDDLTYRTYGIDSSQYKFGLAVAREFDAEVAKRYRMSPWPRNLWVVEAVDRRLQRKGPGNVLGEVIIDPTANHYPTTDQPGIIAAHAPGVWLLSSPDSGAKQTGTCGSEPYRSGRPDFRS